MKEKIIKWLKLFIKVELIFIIIKLSIVLFFVGLLGVHLNFTQIAIIVLVISFILTAVYEIFIKRKN